MKTVLVTYNLPGKPPRQAITEQFVGAANNIFKGLPGLMSKQFCYAMEVKRQLDVLDRHLADSQYCCGEEYSIADIAIWPWYGALVLNKVYGAAEFLDTGSYTHLNRWTNEISARPAVQRGRMVNRSWGEPAEQLRERHDASDFATRTQDKLEAGDMAVGED